MASLMAESQHLLAQSQGWGAHSLPRSPQGQLCLEKFLPETQLQPVPVLSLGPQCMLLCKMSPQESPEIFLITQCLSTWQEQGLESPPLFKAVYFKPGLCKSQTSLSCPVKFGTYRLYLSESALFLSEPSSPLNILHRETIPVEN